MADHENELGNQPVEQKFHDTLTAVMKTIDGLFNGAPITGEKQTGIVMFLFPYGDRAGRVNYISNGANRNDVCRMMEEQLIRFKTDRDDDGPVLEKMALGIEDIYAKNKERPLLNDQEIALAAAALALTIYRKG